MSHFYLSLTWMFAWCAKIRTMEQVKKTDDVFGRIYTVHECNRQTDKQTDRMSVIETVIAERRTIKQFSYALRLHARPSTGRSAFHADRSVAALQASGRERPVSVVICSTQHSLGWSRGHLHVQAVHSRRVRRNRETQSLTSLVHAPDVHMHALISLAY